MAHASGLLTKYDLLQKSKLNICSCKKKLNSKSFYGNQFSVIEIKTIKIIGFMLFFSLKQFTNHYLYSSLSCYLIVV